MALGLDEADTNRQNLDVYKASFEIPFLQATEAFYKAESETFVAKNSVVDYMIKAETRLKEEEDRVDMYLHQSSRKSVRHPDRSVVWLRAASDSRSGDVQLVGTCETVLVKNHSELLQEDFQRLLDQEREAGTRIPPGRCSSRPRG